MTWNHLHIMSALMFTECSNLRSLQMLEACCENMIWDKIQILFSINPSANKKGLSSASRSALIGRTVLWFWSLLIDCEHAGKFKRVFCCINLNKAERGGVLHWNQQPPQSHCGPAGFLHTLRPHYCNNRIVFSSQMNKNQYCWPVPVHKENMSCRGFYHQCFHISKGLFECDELNHCWGFQRRFIASLQLETRKNQPS